MTKSSSINIKEGRIIPGALQLSDDTTIKCIDLNDQIKYLGYTFAHEIKFDSNIVDTLSKHMESLLVSRMVKS